MSESMLRQITAVVISYYSDEMVLELTAQLPPDMPLIVVDNAAESALGQALTKARPGSRYIHLPQNAGFGGAANAGVAQVETDFVVILNPDIDFVDRTLTDAVAMMQADPQLSALGELRPLRFWRFVLTHYITGAFLVLRRQAFEAIEGFDETFFLFYEDTDLSVRLMYAGFHIAGLPTLPRHRDGRSVSAARDSQSERRWLLGASARLFGRKHGVFTKAGLTMRWMMWKTARKASDDARAAMILRGYREAAGQEAESLRDNLFTTGRRRAD
ncbi:glycosyltransferase [Jannaschia sp. CCS1]|uniref:glycosyltransferase n=1 Tax=Jannaschia sp. (strain CCS1) TaxID=290400 RepID=UPI000053B04E|nr:glycosyltransferase [Jannaschia sp. CCS1]ABD57191.1 glycosyl transferase family 2 [Jannaschia sp. CCS1]